MVVVGIRWLVGWFVMLCLCFCLRHLVFVLVWCDYFRFGFIGGLVCGCLV